jgi:hypothetical protein
MNVRMRLAALIALVGASLAATPFFAAPAGAGEDKVGGYTADSLAKGLEVRGGIRNIVTDPLVYLAGPFTRTTLNSIPQSAAIATVAFPGDLAYSVTKEDGVAPSQGLPASWPAADAKYPNRPERSFSVRPATSQYGLSLDVAQMTAHAKEGSNDAVVNGQALEFRPSAGQPAIVNIRTIETLSRTTKTLTGVEQLAQVRASGIELLGGAITIDSIFARARSVSDVLSQPMTEADVRFVDVRVTNSSGGSYRAVIDQDGIRIDDPTLNPKLEQGLNQALGASLGKLGIQLIGLERSRIVDGEQADAAVNALVINLSATCESCGILPPIPVDPRDSVPEPAQDPYKTTTCAAQNVNTALPCLTVQLIPAPTSVFRGTITVAGTRAVAAATPIISFDIPKPSAGDFGGGFEPPFQPGGPTGGFQPGYNAPPPGVPQGNNQQPVVNGRAVALRAEMPDWGLTAAGAAFLAFALLLVLGPSLRRGTAG